MVSFAGTADRAGERTRNTTKFPSFPDANAAAQNVRFALAVWGDNATHTLSISATFFAWWKRAFLHVLVSLRTLFSAANLRAAGGERCCVGYWRYNLILPSTRHKRRCSSCTLSVVRVCGRSLSAALCQLAVQRVLERVTCWFSHPSGLLRGLPFPQHYSGVACCCIAGVHSTPTHPINFKGLTK